MTDPIDALKAQNAILRRQVVAFTRLEQRLVDAQREADAQVRRMAGLSAFALHAAEAPSPEAILELALALLLDLFPYDEGLAMPFVATTGAPTPFEASWRHADGRSRRAARGLSAPPSIVPARPTHGPASSILGCRPALAAAVAAACSARDGSPYPPSPDDPVALLPVPPRRETGAGALLVLLKRPGSWSGHERLIDDRDEAFLGLVAAHVQVALDSALLLAERVRAELALGRSEARLAAILAQLPVGVLVTRGDVIRYANATLGRTLGVSPSALVGRRFTDVVHPDERTAAIALRQAPPAEPVRFLERHLLHRDGGEVVVEETTLALAGRPDVLSIIRDLTEERAIRTQLVRADQLAAVGTLAAGVAHEINNPLAWVILALERLSESVPPHLRDEAAGALDGAARIRDVVRDLRTLSRPAEPAERVEVVSPRPVLEKVLSMAAPALRHRAQVSLSVAPDCDVLANAGRLSQIGLNLVMNAAEAIPAGAADRHRVCVSVTREHEFVALRVSDTGSGMTPEALSRVFTPYFTTKAAGQGLGLGLAVTRDIVERFGGSISVETTLGVGTTFTVRLPAAPPGAAPERTPASPERRITLAGRRVLIVDDEPAIVAVLRRTLRDAAVVTCASGNEACAILAEDSNFDAVLCDLMMPSGGGDVVHAFIASRRPELLPRLALMTGGATSEEGRRFVAEAGLPILEKPFRAGELLAFVDRLARDADGSGASRRDPRFTNAP